jgi:hypothetical protein
MELYQIRHFAAVAETGGFTKAAIRAAVSGQYLRMVRARRGGRVQIAAWLKRGSLLGQRRNAPALTGALSAESRPLPSRARFRFAGSLPIPLHTKLAQSRAQPTCLQFRCLTDGVQSKAILSQVNGCCMAQSARLSSVGEAERGHDG